MEMNRIGKFESRKIVEEFDKALIDLFGRNMSDVGISRFDALSLVAEAKDARKAAEQAGLRRGLQPLPRP